MMHKLSFQRLAVEHAADVKRGDDADTCRGSGGGKCVKQPMLLRTDTSEGESNSQPSSFRPSPAASCRRGLTCIYFFQEGGLWLYLKRSCWETGPKGSSYMR